MGRFFNSQSGTALVLFAFILPALLGLTAVAVDLGAQFGSRALLDNIAQAAALAGAQDVLYDPVNARSKAYEYLALNNVQAGDATVNVSQAEGTVEVRIKRDVDYFFGKALGFDKAKVAVAAKAKGTGISAMTGAAPLGILFQDFEYGQKYKLKCGSPPEFGSGNFGALRLGGSGAYNYLNNLKYGYSGVLAVGDIIETETGNISGPTRQAISYRFAQDDRVPPNSFADFDRDAPQIIYVPVIEPYQTNGNQIHSVRVLGFAAFFISSIPESGNDSEIEGYFIETVHGGIGSDGQTNYGLVTTRLVGL
jgi:Flp pilus assembly protein TadG